MFIELHLLQNFAPSNLNRDDTNNPKDCEFGGARRARISSQCIKRAIRLSPAFAQATAVPTGTRSKWFLSLLRERLINAGKAEEEVNAVLPDFIAAFLSKLDGNGPKTAVLLYLSQEELQGMADALLESWEALSGEKTRGDAIKNLTRDLTRAYRDRTSAPDIAMFGRMLAEKPVLNLEAACQVAHAFSTHRVTMEMDFYTAVDDLNPEDTAGAGMMGFTGFDSACYYRYALIDWDKLLDNLSGDVDLARQSVRGFLHASLEAVPSGKQNSFAAHNPPSFAFAVVRDNGSGWSLANAFERPVRPGRDQGVVAPSIAALDTYWGRINRCYGRDGIVAEAVLALDGGKELENLKGALVDDRQQWVDSVLAVLPQGEKA